MDQGTCGVWIAFFSPLLLYTAFWYLCGVLQKDSSQVLDDIWGMHSFTFFHGQECRDWSIPWAGRMMTRAWHGMGVVFLLLCFFLMGRDGIQAIRQSV